MNTINVWEGRWSTGDVLIADYKIQRDNIVVVQNGFGKGEYYLSGMFAKRFPTEQMATGKGKAITMRAIPLTQLEKEVV